MKKNDDTIQKLFDDYAEDLNERNDLAEKARRALVEQNAQKERQRKSKLWSWLAPVCAALIIVVVSVSIWSPSLFPDNGGMTPSQTPSQGNQNATEQDADKINYYALSEVKGRSVAASQFDETLMVSKIADDDEYEIVYERYYAFYFGDGELAYVKAILGVRSEEGFCEIVIVAEVDGVVRKDLRDIYDYFLKYSHEKYMSTQPDDKGEYVTNAYFKARDSHFYISAMTGANDQLAEKIISKIL